MGSLSPVILAIGIVLVVAIVGVVIAMVRNSTTFSGYDDVAADARQLAIKLKGQSFRDGNDLVVSGTFGKLPTMVRFSHDEHTPGVNIRMQVKATFAMSIAPKGEAGEGRNTVKTPDELFDARFIIRTDQVTQTKMFVGSKFIVSAFKKLCCGTHTFFIMNPGTIELNELTIPGPYAARHIIEHLQSMGIVAASLADMPGADKVKVEVFKEKAPIVGRIAIAAGVIVAIVAVVGAASYKPRQDDIVQAAGQEAPAGVSPVDAAVIPGLSGYRLATADDFDGNAVGWLRGNGFEPTGKVGADFTGDNKGDAGYVLVDKQNGKYRVIVVADGGVRYDSQFQFIGIAARVPKGIINSIQWNGAPPQDPDGDGLLILRQQNDPSSGLIIFLKGTRIMTASPTDYQRLSLR